MESLEPLDLIKLVEIHLELSHGVLTLQKPLLALVVVNILDYWLFRSICFNLNDAGIVVVLLKDLLTCEDILDL